jgi:hypothetical protein
MEVPPLLVVLLPPIRVIQKRGVPAGWKEGTVTADQNDVRRHVRKILDKLAQRLADKRGGSAGSSKIKGKQ